MMIKRASKKYYCRYPGRGTLNERNVATVSPWPDDETIDIYDEPIIKANDEMNIKAELIHIKSGTKIECERDSHQRDQIIYCPIHRGEHELYISVNEVPVQGSPIPITVIGPTIHVQKDLLFPRGIVVNSKGQLVVVSGNDNTSISVFTKEGEPIKSLKFVDSELSNAFGVTVDQDDNIYVVENGNHQIRKFSAEGVLLATAGSRGSGNLQFLHPIGICYNSSDNNVYIADNCNNRIQVLTSDLKFVRCFGAYGSKNGQFRSPNNLAFDSANNLYVTDDKNHQVQVFTAEGQFLRAFSQKAEDQLKHPWAIAINSNDIVYVSEVGRSEISLFTTQGLYIDKIEEFKNIHGFCIDCNDVVFVSDQN